MGSSAKFHDDGRAPSWTLHDLGKEGRAPGTPFKLNRRAADLHDDGRAQFLSSPQFWEGKSCTP